MYWAKLINLTLRYMNLSFLLGLAKDGPVMAQAFDTSNADVVYLLRRNSSHFITFVVHLAGYLLFFLLFSIFYYRIRRDPPPGLAQMHTLMIATMISSGWVILRSIYRLIEMGEGWDGVINETEWCLFVFDACFVFFAVTVYNIVHPGKYLPKNFSWNYNPDKHGIWWGDEKENELESPPVAYPENAFLPKEQEQI
ncbi:hypothetical protein MCAP1_001701 [Malassezia caprae]|uniref:Uncharacterized protein n=1 Tax=Malassezia caprae TaxID=1381934 RepID=A0AAF0EA19_9BASI|nr:hypothetical protein MCAP1_001701 [Malassezia caprae]